MGYYRTKVLTALKEQNKSGGGSSPGGLTAKATTSLGGNVFVRSAATVGDLVSDVLVGALKSLEGVGDFALTGVGAVGGIFDSNVREQVRRLVEYDLVGNHLETPLESLTKDSYFNDLRIGKYDIGEAAELVAQGVGGMLPSVAVAIMTGGTSLAAQAASMGTMAAGAAGNATEQAFNEGASYGGGAAYGAARGAIEAATEKLGGVVLGGGSSAVGKALAGTTLGNAVQKGAGRVAYNFVSEGAEEVLSDLTDPLTKYVTGVDKDIGKNYNEVMQGLGKTFMVGGTVGTVMGGAQDNIIARTKAQLARGGARAVRSDRYLQNAMEVSENLGTDGKDGAKYTQSILQSYQNVSDELVQMTESERKRYLESIGAHKLAFDENGKVIAAAAENVNPDAVSPALRAVSANLSHSPISAETETSESARVAKDTVQKAIGKGANVVISEDIGDNNALYNPDEDVIYISNGTFDGSDFSTEDIARAIALHEVAHKAEGTAAYLAMTDELQKILEDESAPAEVKTLLGDVMARRDTIKELYKDESLNEEQDQYVVATELVANMAGDLLSSPYFVERMGARNDSAWKRFVTALKVAHDGKAGGISKSSQKYLSKLYGAYVRAVDDAGQGFKISSMVDEEEKEKALAGNSVANERGARKSFRRDFDISQYDEIELEPFEYSRLHSEALTWDAKYRNVPLITTLTYDIVYGDTVVRKIDVTYRYVIDKRGNIHVYNRKDEINSNERGEYYDNTDREESNSIVEELRFGQENDSRGLNSLRNGRESTDHDRNNLRPLSKTGGGERNGYSEDRTLAHGQEEDNAGKINPDERKSKKTSKVEPGDNFKEDKYYARQIDNWENLKEGGYITVGEVVEGSPLNLVGIPSETLYFDVSKILKEMKARKDVIPPDKMKGIPSVLNDPIVITEFVDRSGTHSANVYGKLYIGTSPVVVGVMIAKTQKGNIVNKIQTVHPNRNVMEEMFDGNILYLSENKNETRAWFQSLGARKPPLGGNTFGFIRSISHSDDFVNKKKTNERQSKQKVYPKKDASTVIDEVVSEHLIFDDVYGEMKGKTKKDATNILWKALNTAEPGKRGVAALRVADYVIDNAVAKTFGEDPNVEIHAKTLSVLKPYLHKLDLDGIKGEIVNRFGKKNSIHLVWGKREGDVGVAPDAIKAELNEQGVLIEANNPSDIFFEIYDLYNEAKEGLERSARALLKNGLTSEEREALRQEIAKDILKAYDEKGAETLNFGEFYKELERAQRRAEFWRTKYFDERDKNYITNRLLDKVRKLDDLKKGAFLSATQSRTWVEKFKGSIFRLSQIRFRGNLNRRGTRRIMATLHAWYTDENNELIQKAKHLYDDNIATALKNLANNERVHTEAENAILDSLMSRFKTSDLKKLFEQYTVENMGKDYDGNVKQLLHELSSESIFDKEELLALEKVVDYFTHFATNFNMVYYEGEYVKTSDLAKKYIDRFSERERKSSGMLRKWFERYYISYGDPMAVARHMDNYDEHGFFTEMLSKLRRAAIDAAILEMEINEPIDEFFKKHKRFPRELREKKVKIWDGSEIPLAKAISLYMTLGREQALLGLARKGFAYQFSEKSEDVIRVNGFAPGKEIADTQLTDLAKEKREDIYKQFTEDEKTYIGLVEKALEACKNAKHDTDMIRYGYSNTIEGYYFPIARAYVSHSIDSVKYKDEIDRVSSKSFNNNTVKNASGELWINDVDAILDRHVRGVTQYAKLSTFVDTFDSLYSIDVSDKNADKITSIETESRRVWAENKKYFKKLMDDAQGVRTGDKDTLVAALLPTIRSGYAKYLLGANPKVWLTQLSSVAASTSILDVSSIIKGFSLRMEKNEVDQYCALAKLRNNDNTAALAQGVLDKVSGFGDVLMKPIGAVDRFVINCLFAACRVQVAKNGTAALGTEENKVKAGELLERVILETQQNSLATERSAAMRSDNEAEKTLTMFSADAMKVFGRVVDAWGEATTLKRMIKLAADKNNTAEVEQYKKALGRAEKQLRRSVGALLSSAVMMALIAQLFRRLLNKKDKDEVAKNITCDVVSGLVGGLPLVRDITDYMTNGYDIDYYAFSAANDLLESTSEIFALGRDAIDGEWDSKKTAKALRNAFYSAGMMLGVPTRNMYNYSYGVINMISPETGYKMDDLFYSKSYREDLTAAIESGDEGMIATITGIMIDSSVGGMNDKTLRGVMRDLLVADFDVLPQSVKDSVTYDGQKYELSGKQKKAFEKIYSEAHGVAATLVKSKGFASASDEVKAKAISFVYDLYYDMAVYDRVGGVEDKNTLFAKAIDVSVLALAISTARTFESDKDENGNAISGSLKKKIRDYVESLPLKAAQKYMIMGYLGYKNAEGEAGVRAYIQSLKMTAVHKQALFNASGY